MAQAWQAKRKGKLAVSDKAEPSSFPTSSWARRGSALPRPVSLRLPLWCWREPSPSCGAAQSLVPCALYARHAQSHGLVAWEAELADWAGVTPNGHLYALLTFLAVGLATVESTSDSDDAEKLSRARGHAIPRARRRLRATAARRLRGGGSSRRPLDESSSQSGSRRQEASAAWRRRWQRRWQRQAPDAWKVSCCVPVALALQNRSSAACVYVCRARACVLWYRPPDLGARLLSSS